MKKRIRQLICSVLVLMLVLSCAGCGGNDSAADTTAAAGGTQAEEAAQAGSDDKIINVATSESIVKCDPHDQQGWPGRAGVAMVMEPLITTDHEGNFFPLLAESWDIAEDGLEITFHLYDGIYASNGEVFNADDVVATYNRILSDNTLNTTVNYWSRLDTVEKVDDLTVTFHFTEPEACAMDYFTATFCFPDEAYAEYGDRLWLDQIMIGTGPWVWDEWVDGQYLHLTKNQDYWKKDEYDPYYEEFYMRFLTEESSAIAAQLAGDIDAYISVGGISKDSVGLYEGTEDTTEIIEMKTSLFHFIGFQCGEGRVFHDMNLRRAFSMAFDREAIGTSLIGDNIEVSKGGLSFSFTLGYDENMDSPYYHYNPEEAARLVEESGYDGSEINFLIGSNVPYGENIGLLIAEYCQAIGLNVNTEIAEIASFQDRRKAGDYDCYLTTDGVNYGEIYNYMKTRLVSDIHQSHYVNDTFTQLVEESGHTLDIEMRDELYRQCNEILAEDVPHINLFCSPKIYAINYGVTGIQLFPDGDFNFSRIDYDASAVK